MLPDIAVGAPYEEDGAGAVYIYLGSTECFCKIRDVYVQRIAGKQGQYMEHSLVRRFPMCNPWYLTRFWGIEEQVCMSILPLNVCQFMLNFVLIFVMLLHYVCC